MKKNHIIVQIVLYSVLALVLINLLGGLLAGHGWFRFNNLRWFGNDITNYSESTKQVGETTISEQDLSELNGIRLEMTSQDVTVLASKDNQLHIKQYGEDANASFTTYNNNGVMTIQGHEGKNRRWFRFFGIGSVLERQRIELYLPDSFKGDLSIQSSAGETDIQRPLTLNSLTLDTSAGTFLSDSPIECQKIHADVSAGSIQFQQLTSADYDLNATTGEISVEQLYGGGQMTVTMGEIDAGIYGIEGTASFTGTLGEIDLEVQRDVSFSFRGSKTVGDLTTNFPCTTSGSTIVGQVGDSSSNILEATVTAGDISVTIDD